MTKYSYYLLLSCLMFLAGCQTVEPLAIDYMLPADVSFPPSLKRVAIVNNMPEVPDNKPILAKEKKKDDFEIASKTDYYNGNAAIATESLAEALAHENYFNEVVICDSALRAHDVTPREGVLSQEETNRLVHDLDVDLLIALENVQIRSVRKIKYMRDWGIYYGTVDARIYFLIIHQLCKKKKGNNMEKENIKTVTIEDFKNSQHILDYLDDDFAIVNSLDGIPYSNEIVRLECFLIAVCIEGCIQLDINNKTYQLQPGDLLLGLPNTIIGHTMMSPKYKIRLAGFSTRFLQRILKVEKDTWDTAIHIHNNPIKSISRENDNSIFKYYGELIMAKINDEPHCYHKAVVQHLFSALFCEMLGYLNKEIADSEKAFSKEGIKQADHILRKFMELLSKDNGMHRSVTYFADALCYTPKHFSKVIKQACGRAPLDLINETAIEHIKYRLKHSDKSIKEIAEEFNFPNQSFFGKYVKGHLGTSPIRDRSERGG